MRAIQRLLLITLALTTLTILSACEQVIPITDISFLDDLLDELDPKEILLKDFPVYAQPDAYTCGVTTISMIVSYLVESISPEELIVRYGLENVSGMSAEVFQSLLDDILTGYSVDYLYDIDERTLIAKVHQQLNEGYPVPFFFGSPNPYNEPYYDFHASAVIGINIVDGFITVANAYGYEEEIDFIDFLNRTAYREIEYYPPAQQLIILLGMMPQNSIFLIKVNEEQ